MLRRVSAGVLLMLFDHGCGWRVSAGVLLMGVLLMVCDCMILYVVGKSCGRMVCNMVMVVVVDFLVSLLISLLQ